MCKISFKYREDKNNILVISIEDLKIGLQLERDISTLEVGFKDHIQQCVTVLKNNALKRGATLEEQPIDELIEYYSKGSDYVKKNLKSF